MIWTLLLGFALIAGTAAFLCGRLPDLTQGIQSLSLGRVAPYPYTSGVCFAVGAAAPLLFLLVIGVMHLVAKKLGGHGTYRAQCYTSLLIGLPFLLVILAAAFVLNAHPVLGETQRLAFGLVALAIVAYEFMLYTFAVMAVQQLRANKAMLAVLVALIVVVVLIVIAVALLDSDSSVDSSRGEGSGGSRSKSSHDGGDSEIDWEGDDGDSSRGTSARMITLRCPNCGLSFPVPASQVQFAGFCPRCGTPLITS